MTDRKAQALNALYRAGALPLVVLSILLELLAEGIQWCSDALWDLKGRWLVRCRRWNGQDAEGYTPAQRAEQEARRVAFLALMRGAAPIDTSSPATGADARGRGDA